MQNNETLTCPHCHENVPYGARVCRGCQAEVHYPKISQMPYVILYILLFSVFSVLAAVFEDALKKLGINEHGTIANVCYFLLFLAVALCAIYAHKGLKKWLEKRFSSESPTFHRVYKTKA